MPLGMLFSMLSAGVHAAPFTESFPSLSFSETKNLTKVKDLNGDGRDDFISWLCEPSQILLILSSDVGFTKTVLESGLAVSGVGSGDVNLDGIPDLIAVGPNSARVEFRYGFGDGTFGEPFIVAYSGLNPSDCAGPVPVNIADVDGDGVEELVLVGRIRTPGQVMSTVVVVPFSQDGPASRHDAVPGESWPFVNGTVRDVRLTDLDGDGVHDLLILFEDDPQAYLCRLEGRVYSAPVALQTPSTLGAVFAYMNGDRMPDLLRSDGTSFIIELLSVDGPSESVTIDTGRSWSAHVNVGDVDLDGSDDFVLVEYQANKLHVVMTELLSGDPKLSLLPFAIGNMYSIKQFFPGFASPGSIDYLQFRQGSPSTVSTIQPAHDGVTPLFRTVCMDTRSGLQALMLDLGDPALNTYIVDGNGIWAYKLDTGGRVTETDLLPQAKKFLAGDFNGDSLPDLALVSRDITFMLSTVSGALTPLPSVGFPYGTFPVPSIVIDIDQDGRDEVIIAPTSSVPGGYLVQANDNDVTLSDLAINFSTVFGGAFDADNDGYPDLILSNIGRTVVVFNRNGVFNTEPVTLFEGFREATTIVGHDIDADGFEDLVILFRNSAEMAIFWGYLGGISEPQIVTLDQYHGPYSGISIFDVDGNGLKDIVVSGDVDAPTITPKIAFQTGERTFGRIGSISSAYGRSVIRTDVNGDDVPDTILLQSSRQFSSPACGALLIFGSPDRTCTADLNADGVLDASDLSLLINLYHTADPAIDLAEPFGDVNFADILAYLAAYNAGCP